MYAVSADFHAAILTGAKQKALLKFADTIFTNSDIAMQGGLALTEPFCAQEELTIGLCPSAFLSASLLNESGQLDTFTFGQFTAYLGVLTTSGNYFVTYGLITDSVSESEDYGLISDAADSFDDYGTIISGATAVIPIGADLYSIHDAAPYVRKNGTGTSGQPAFAPKAMIVLDGLLYVISSAGAYYRYCIDGLTHAQMAQFTHAELAEFTHAELNGTINVGAAYSADDVMVHKGIEWAANNAAIVFEDAAITEYSMDGTYEVYEMCPIGVFNVERPATVRKMVVKFTAYDNMSLTDVDITSWFAALTYPKTLGAMYAALCTELGIATTTTTFINSTHSYASAPFTSNSLTGRQLLKYIAEAACAIARCDRAGNLLLDWFAAETHTISRLTGITIAEYEVAAVDKLQVQAVTTDAIATVGTGTNSYVLLANQLIVGEIEADLTAFATDISTRLFAYAAFTPISAKMPADWSLQSGDIIDITYETVTYSMPIYSQVITWNGNGKATLNSTGKPVRDVTDLRNQSDFLTQQNVLGINANATEAIALLSDIASDTKITPSEKLNAKQLWDAIVVEGTPTTGTIPVQAIALGVADTNFDTAYAALNTYLNTTLTVFSNMTTTTNITRSTWDTAWKNYYEERTQLLAALGAKANALVAATGTFDSLAIAAPTNDFLDMRLGEFSLGAGLASGVRWDISDADEWAGLFESDTGELYLQGTALLYISTNLAYPTGSLYLDSVDNIFLTATNVTVDGIFSDTTPAYAGDALLELSTVKSIEGKIDHKTLPPAARTKIKRNVRDAKGKPTKEVVEQDGRDLGMMISILTKAVQQLTEIVNKQQEQIDKLKGKQ